jgi:hypothetical protein
MSPKAETWQPAPRSHPVRQMRRTRVGHPHRTRTRIRTRIRIRTRNRGLAFWLGLTGRLGDNTVAANVLLH